MKCDYLIVGAGFYGSVLAERLANDLKAYVIVIDKRNHIGGNCYSTTDEETGIEYHRYGTHIFHTSSPEVWQYISQFTEFNGYHHQVLTRHENKVYQIPINLETINSFYNINLTPLEARKFIEEEISQEKSGVLSNFEEQAIALVGRPLYEAFIKDYTIKQWGKHPQELPASIIKRLPVRYDYREDYFLDARWQGLPLEGYTAIFQKMLKSSNIDVQLSCNYFDFRQEFEVHKKIIYTGPIDQYFDYQCGRLQWRSIELKQQVMDREDFQGTAVMNYADNNMPYTRIHEPRHLHVERAYRKDKTLIFHEYSKDDRNSPYYPVRMDEDKNILQRYKDLARKEAQLIIGGRLGDYVYYDMDKTILAALKCYEKIKESF